MPGKLSTAALRPMLLSSTVMLVVGCPSDAPTGPGSCETHPTTTNDCCCFATMETDKGVYIENECPAEPQCGNLQIQCPAGGPDCPLPSEVGGEGELSVGDEAVLDCILTALRDGTQGTLKWRYTAAGAGYAYLDQVVHILPNRRALYSAHEVIDFGEVWSDVTHETLVAPERFDACLQAVDLPARLSCLLPRPTDGEVITVCTEGGSYSEF